MSCTCFVVITLLLCADAVFSDAIAEQNAANFGTTLYTKSDVEKHWTDTELIALQCRMLIGWLIPTKIPDNGETFLAYFDLIKNHTTKINSLAIRKRTMIIIVDAIGGYMHTKMLPQFKLFYYDGKMKYSTMKRLHDLLKAIKHVLGTDGRGWAKPTAGIRDPPYPEADDRLVRFFVPTEETKYCGGVDAGPYVPPANDNGTGRESAPPLFDENTRPHSLVIPWQPLRPVLYSVRDASCHRALFDYCVRSVYSGRHDHEAVRRHVGQWLDAAVGPLVTPEAATGRWYPALWGASVAIRHVAGPPVDHNPERRTNPNDDYYLRTAPDFYFYAAVVFAHTVVFWLISKVATFICRPTVEKPTEIV
ncbi:Hypothetical protein CINCED_3A016216 [Cinara cedri]|uniref:Uncharacterized protein n=1 Tax=Cinara cedri TaxID=506608 RepID=A0A5E4MF18_9HEMI|nr:Hypothetical protein CINCED_3A016216 [Cinara cedri]